MRPIKSVLLPSPHARIPVSDESLWAGGHQRAQACADQNAGKIELHTRSWYAQLPMFAFEPSGPNLARVCSYKNVSRCSSFFAGLRAPALCKATISASTRSASRTLVCSVLTDLFGTRLLNQPLPPLPPKLPFNYLLFFLFLALKN